MTEVKLAQLVNIEKISYSDALQMQYNYHRQCAGGEINGVLMLLEHNPVITMGVKPDSANNVLASVDVLKRHGVELVNTDRGGDATYHGPGQLVGYPIFRVREMGGDLHTYLRNLEETIIKALAHWGLKGDRNGPAGVWVGDRKVCSIGVAVRKWVTYHGFAFNIEPDMSHFSLINPCGLNSNQISSLALLLGKAPEMKEIRDVCAKCFEEVFEVKFEFVV